MNKPNPVPPPVCLCPNGHGPMRHCWDRLAPDGPIGESWECDICRIQCMWPNSDAK